MRLPTASEINPFPECLDGQCAVRHFLSKGLQEAEALFRENALYYQENLMFMGASAFRFYVHAYISYIRSEAAEHDSSAIHGLVALLEYRLEFEPEELAAVAKDLCAACEYIVEHYDRYGLILEAYGDLRPRLEVLQQEFRRMAAPD